MMGALERILSPPVPPAAVSRVLSRFDRPALEGFIAVALDLLDFADGDADTEDDDPAETAGDEVDASWTEWDRRGRHKLTVGGEPFDDHEDTEDDDLDACLAADDIGTASTPWHCKDCYPGDPGDAEENGDREGVP